MTEESSEQRPAGEGALARVERFFFDDLWHVDLRPRSLTATALRLLQLGVMIGQGFVRDQLLLRASALTYVTILSLIPLLIVTLAFASMVGGREALIDLLMDQLTVVSPDARDWLIERIQDVKIASMGTIGASMLLITTVLALRHLEATLNEIWGIRVSRGWMRRLSDYTLVIVIAPILTTAAISLAATLQSEPLVERLLAFPLFARLYDAGLAQLPTLLLLVAFTFLYWFFPNTRVRPLSALLGGVVAALLFSLARYFYVEFSIGAARYSMLFGGLVALPLILAWLYVAWSVVLLGAEVSFAHQNLSRYRREVRVGHTDAAEREAEGLRISVEIARAFVEHEPPPLASQLSEELDIPVRSVRELLESFTAAGLVIRCGDENREGGYAPARPVADISVSAVMVAVRGLRQPLAASLVDDAAARATETSVDDVLGQLERAAYEVGDRLSLADVLRERAEA